MISFINFLIKNLSPYSDFFACDVFRFRAFSKDGFTSQHSVFESNKFSLKSEKKLKSKEFIDSFAVKYYSNSRYF